MFLKKRFSHNLFFLWFVCNSRSPIKSSRVMNNQEFFKVSSKNYPGSISFATSDHKLLVLLS